MKYKTIASAVAVLLIATPALAQKAVPIITQTPRTTVPTTVITGQSLQQTYIIRFIDLSHRGEEIIIKKEDLLGLKLLDDFEVVNVDITYQTKQGQFLEHLWYVSYTLKIIQPKKGPKVIPSFVVPWKHKKAGQQENDPTLQYDYSLKTEPVHLNYVSTIPEKDPYIIIRDEVDLGSSWASGLALRFVSWFLAVVPLGLWLFFFVRGAKASAKHSREEKAKADRDDKPVPDVVRISKRRALRNLRSAVKKLKKSQDAEVRTDIYGVLSALKDFLVVRAGMNTGSTPSEMVAGISANKKLGLSRKPLLALAKKASRYQDYIESGSITVIDAKSEAMELRKLIAGLRWYNRLFRRR